MISRKIQEKFPAPLISKIVWRGKSISRTALPRATYTMCYVHEGLRQKLGDHRVDFSELEMFSRKIQEKFHLTELKRLRGRLEVVRWSLDSGIAICGAQCRCDPQLRAEGAMALEGGLRGPTPCPLAADLGLFLEPPLGASVDSALQAALPVSTGIFILKFFIYQIGTKFSKSLN